MDLSKLTPSDMIAILSLVVAILSLVINIVPIVRDKARIDFSLYLAEAGHFAGNKFVKTEEAYAFRIVNSGRRPITVTHVGGVTGETSFIHYWFWRITRCCPPMMFFINEQGLNSLLRDSNGNDRTLAEGEYSFGTVQINAVESKKGEGLKARQFHVIDSLGKYHRLPFFAHRAFIRSVNNKFKKA